MSGTTEVASSVAGTGLPERLQLYSRYLALVAQELAALQRRDLSRLREVAEERVQLEEELRAPAESTAEDGTGESRCPAELEALLTTGLSQLADFTMEEQRERKQWMMLEDDALRALCGSRLDCVRAGRYVASPSSDARLDVRF